MKNQNSINADTHILKQKAEALLKKRKQKEDRKFSESEMHKIFHELQVHQIELEIQNEELLNAKKQVEEAANEKYAKLFNLSPSGYFALSHEGEIVELNKSGAKMLGKDYEILLNTPFDSYISNYTKANFYQFIDKIFNSDISQTCDVVIENNLTQKYICLTGIFNQEGQNCLITTFDITDRKLKENELAEKDEFLQTIYDHSGISTFIVKVNGIDKYEYEHVNKTYESIFGIKAEEIIGKSPNDLVYFYGKDTIDYVNSIYNKCVTSKEVHESEFEALLENGKKDWWLSRISPLIDSHGEVYKIIGTTIKITDRKLTEIALQESKQKYKDFVNHSPNLIYKYSSIRGSLFWSDSVKKILGYLPDEIQQNPFLWSNSVHPDFKQLVQKAIDDDEKGDNYSIEYRIQTKSGKWIWLHNTFMHKTIIGDETIIEGYATDITERKEAEQALKESEHRYRAVIDSSPLGVLIYKTSGECVYANQSAAQITGGTVEGLKSLNFRKIQSWKFGYIESAEECLLKNVMTKNEVHSTSTFGVEIWNEAFFIPISIMNEKHLLVMLSDVKERKKAEQALKESEEHLQLLIKGTQDYYFKLKILEDGNPFIEYVSENFYATNGRSISEVQSYDRWNAIIHPDEIETLQNNFLKIIKNRESISFESRSIVKKELRYIELNSFPIVDRKTDKVTHILGSVKDITFRKKAEEALKASNKKFLTLANNLPAMVAYVNVNTMEYEFVNIEYQQLIGKPIEEIIGSHPREVIGERNFQYALKYIEEAKAGKSVSYETLFPLAKGKRWLVTNYVPDFDENGKVKSVIVLSYDLTERKQVEEALKESEEKYRTLAANLPGAVYRCGLVDPWIIEYFSEPIFDITGYTAADFISNKITYGELVHTDDRQRIADQVEQAIKDKIDFELEYRIRHKNGDWHWILERGKAVYDQNGNAIYLDGVDMDITDRKLAEQALLKSEIILNISQQLSKTGGWEYDVENQTMFWTAETAQIYDFEKTGPLSGPVAAFHDSYKCFEPDDRTKLHTAFELCVSSGEPYDLEFQFTSLTGRHLWIKTTGKAFVNDSGKIIKVVGTFMDVTERKKAELIIQTQYQELTKLNSDKDRFITILAHDLKNPFNALMGLSELLSKNVYKYDLENIENLINIIHRTSKRTYNLLEELLLWGRAQSGKLPFEPKKLIFADICEKIIEDLKLAGDTKNIKVNNLATNEIDVFADLNMLKVILRNLLSNAIKFTNIGGKIEINLEQNQTNSIISVSDNGIGISNEVLIKLFDISQTYTTKGTQEETGTGLGLLICKEFVEKHGGIIWIESELGTGSVFKFSIPKGDK